MSLETESVGNGSADDGEIVAAIDEADGRPQLVIADIARDDVWLSISERDAVSLETWR
ncbi:DUF7556 family protein [Natronorubrum halalkaliphilum]|uniref:DUF7556 family protein n=1 Tax=Natronorubrum halalkaliphilum TaxID=2691917 RepID=UPI001916B3B1|nr:hypothetical protein [Natronorubrum halalkaliphilum]